MERQEGSKREKQKKKKAREGKERGKTGKEEGKGGSRAAPGGPSPGPLAAAPATPPAQPSCLLPPQGSLLPPAPHNLSWACSGLWKSLGHTLLLPSCWHLPEGLGPQGLRLRQDHPDSFPCRWPPYPAQAGPPQSTPGSGQVSVLVPQQLGTVGQAGLLLCLPGAQVLNS